jgi:DNA mismatch repair protein MutS
VAELVEDGDLLGALSSALDGIPDLERLGGRVGLGLATPRELAALRSAIDLLPGVAEAAARATSPRMRRLAGDLDPLADLSEILHTRLADDPAPSVGPGVIAEGWDDELDEQRSLARGGKELLAGSRRRNGNEPGSPSSRSSTTRSSAISSRSPRRISTAFPRTTTDARP